LLPVEAVCYGRIPPMSEPLQSLLHLVRRHRAGTVLFREGEPGEKMFLIQAGKVNIVKRIAVRMLRRLSGRLREAGRFEYA